jgi:hypothetical protein
MSCGRIQQPEGAVPMAHNHGAGVRDDKPFLEKQLGSLVETFQKGVTPLATNGQNAKPSPPQQSSGAPRPENKTVFEM